MAKMAQNEQNRDFVSNEERAADAGRDNARSASDAGKATTLKAVEAGANAAREAADAGREGAREAANFADRAAPSREDLGAARRRIEQDAGSVMELVHEQTRHSLELASAYGGAVRWDAVLQAQSDFIGGTFERIGRFNDRYFELMRAGMDRMPFKRGS